MTRSYASVFLTVEKSMVRHIIEGLEVAMKSIAAEMGTPATEVAYAYQLSSPDNAKLDAIATMGKQISALRDAVECLKDDFEDASDLIPEEEIPF